MTPLQLAIEEIDRVTVQYENPVQELFLRYLRKNKEEQEAFVMALSANLITLHKRLQVASGI